MKNLLVLTAFLLFISCSEDENNTPSQPIDDPFDPGAMNVDLLKEGTLAGVGHSVGGTVKIYDDNGKKTVVLDPFTSQNGPDLKVYLATDDKATRYINLGALKSTTGKQSYAIEGMPDLDEYTFVLIWCQEFSVLFGKAALR
jgi:Electron transfer DM13